MKINPQLVDQLLLGTILVDAGIIGYRIRKYLLQKKATSEVITAKDILMHACPEIAFMATASAVWIYRHSVQEAGVAAVPA